jgi:dipeptidyl aminopeptidase/acylaminoacyl peptidase
MYKQMRDNINSLNENSEYSPNQLMGISKDYWLFYKNYDPLEYAKDIDKKLLIINGSRDYQVPISEFELWKEKLDGKENVDFKLYEGMNHLLFIGEGTPSPQEYMKAKNVTQELINDIYDWINKK